MPPSSRFARRCLVFLLLVAGGASFLARPAEAGKRPFAGIVDDAARRHGVDPDLVHAVIASESGYRTSAQSPAGAQGLMQLMPGTQRDLGVADAFDPRQNVDAGVAYLRRLTDEFGTVLAIAAYNAGPGAVRRYNGIPPYAETRAYVRAVLDRGRPAAGAKATEEHDPSKDRALAVSEADVAEDAPVDRRLQDDHLAMDAAAGLEPRVLDAALDPEDAELRRNGPGLPAFAAMPAPDPGALRRIVRRPFSRNGRRGPTPAGSGQCAPAGEPPPSGHATPTRAGSLRGRPGTRSLAAAPPGFKMHTRTAARRGAAGAVERGPGAQVRRCLPAHADAPADHDDDRAAGAPTRWSTPNGGSKPASPSGFRPSFGAHWSICSTKRSTPA